MSPDAARVAPADLADERDHLLRAIEDLDCEHESGEVDDADYAELRAGYVARAAAVLRAIEAGPEPAAVAPGPGRVRRRLGGRRVRRGLGAVLGICVLGLVTLFALRAAGVRLPGETATGNVSLNGGQQIRDQLQQAQQLGAAGDVRDALALYQTVLTEDPRQPEALAYRGWLVRLTGLEAKSKPASAELVAAGRSSIEEAVAVAPGYGDAHLFLGLTLLEDSHSLLPAVAQFRAALADHASPALVQSTRPLLVKAFQSAHEAVPASLGHA